MATITSLVDVQTTTNQGKPGDTLQINGTGLGSTTRVNFGSVTVTSGLTVTSTQVSLTVPSTQCAGQVPVSVTSNTNVTSNSLPFFLISAPSVTGVGTTCGPAAGGTPITLFGTNFLTGTGATVGGGSAGSFAVSSSSQATFTTPAHTMTPGSCIDTVDVVISTFGGSSPSAGALSQFSYYAPPAITSLSPATGTAGDEIVINGTCFNDVSAVEFSDGVNTIPATWTPFGDTLLTAVVPAGLTAGPGTVTVTTCGGTSPTAAFTIT
ncbi:IPT/TIG domain-containing protein [Streptomyces sp. NPDC004542]|uniref:IPT/TIG domain-containing protein n=1 Tax=Streptomyces sp. NPDC004542 TaxID=3154281 RepID=UPI0033BE90A7